MLLAIDIGNTRIKYAVFEHDIIVAQGFFGKEALEDSLKKILKEFPEITDLIVASVGNVSKEAFLSVNDSLKLHFITHDDSFPFKNQYATPHTLGIDRMVLSAGAVLKFPMKNRLIIDSGTCITYDFVDQTDHYLGGAISPGIRLRYEALHQYTARLPLLSKSEPLAVTGNSTNESIHSGVVNGIAFEMDGFIDSYKERYSNFIIILTGGDAEFLAKRLKNTIFAHSNFLLESLSQTFQYKIKND
ncbi:type III pantothenate kinase [Flavobacterium noncentrifugens]|uniref:Type III pantothenate kinase n=1 Tax=Flavobacterium noncentrifugens TaxID=1128970 RepID=A0A1G9AW83_9FLAO|nr:type III pantothenate kinase [Flavobacterium noncentrifugens]GEP51606.1 type III pantothenate kinase [Flavobacterium noncentrifugens]SDK31571.1 type III pantothenate kinase [Flavobacterium noncentrifugens]